MTKREQLIEQYEDAVFALVMDKIAASEGEKYLRLNRQLKDDPTAEVPENVRRQAEKAIGRAFRKARTTSIAKIFCNVVNKVAVFFLAISMVFATAFTAFADFRESTYHFVMRMFDDHFEYEFSERTPIANEKNISIEPEWIPNGYSFVTEGSDSMSSWKRYMDEKGNYLSIRLTQLNAAGIDFTDSEETLVSWASIQGFEITIFRGNFLQAIIPVPNSKQMIHIVASSPDFSQEDLIKIAESLISD